MVGSNSDASPPPPSALLTALSSLHLGPAAAAGGDHPKSPAAAPRRSHVASQLQAMNPPGTGSVHADTHGEPGDCEQLLCRAQGLLRQGRHEDAFLAARRALDACPPEPLTCGLWSLLASCLEALGSPREAYALAMKGAVQMKDTGRRQQLASQAVRLLGAICRDGPHARRPRGTPAAEAGGPPHLDTQPEPHQLPSGIESAARNSAGASAAGGASPPPATSPPPPFRVLCLSDLHVDKPGGRNLAALESISRTAFVHDVLVVAGDIGDTFEAVRRGLLLLRPRFWRVVFVPGNHDLWIRPDSPDASRFPDSLCKLWAVLDLCAEIGVDTGAIALPVGPSTPTGGTSTSGTCTASTGGSGGTTTGGTSTGGALAAAPALAPRGDAAGSPGSAGRTLWIVPLLSWYNCAFDEMDPRPGRFLFDSFCKWPVSDLDVWQVMLRLNASTVARAAAEQQQSRRSVTDAAAAGGDLVITVSHFLPHQGLPFSHFQPEMAKAVGCCELQTQMQQVCSNIHVYGHTHINADIRLPVPLAAVQGRYVSSKGTAVQGRYGGGTTDAVQGQPPGEGSGGAGSGAGRGAVKGAIHVRYVHHALDGAGHEPTLSCVWDGTREVQQRLRLTGEVV